MSFMSRHDLDRQFIDLAVKQHRLVRRDQLPALGISHRIMSRRVLAHRWATPHPHVLGLPGWDSTLTGRLLAAAWSLERAYICGRAAAEAHGILDAPPGMVEAVVPAGEYRTRSFTVHQSAYLPPAHTTMLGLLPITSLERTIVDVARWWGPKRLRVAVDDLLACGRTTVGALEDVAVPLVGRGVGHTSRLHDLFIELGSGYVAPASELERLLHDLVRRGGFPPLARQLPLPALREEGRADGAYDFLQLIVEADGRRWHTRVEQLEKDLRRDAEAGSLGWHVARFTHHAITHDPEWVLEVLAAHFTRGGWSRTPNGVWVPTDLAA